MDSDPHMDHSLVNWVSLFRHIFKQYEHCLVTFFFFKVGKLNNYIYKKKVYLQDSYSVTNYKYKIYILHDAFKPNLSTDKYLRPYNLSNNALRDACLKKIFRSSHARGPKLLQPKSYSNTFPLCYSHFMHSPCPNMLYTLIGTEGIL